MECVQSQAGTSVCWDYWISGMCSVSVVPECDGTSIGQWVSGCNVFSLRLMPLCAGTIGSLDQWVGCVKFKAGGTSVCWDHWISGCNVFNLRLVPVCAGTIG